MRKRKVGVIMVMFALSWLACRKENRPQITIEEITPNREKTASRLIKEVQVDLDIGGYAFMPIRSDASLYVGYQLTQNEIKLQRYGTDLSRRASHSVMHGQGPGEWVNFVEFVGNDKAILMVDRGADRITWFDGQMNLVSTIKPRLGINCSSIHSEMMEKENGAFGFYYMTKMRISGKAWRYYAVDFFQVLGGEVGPKGLDCEVHHEDYRVKQKDPSPVYELGPKLYFAQAGDSLYIVDAETYTLTRKGLDGVPIRSVRLNTERPEFSKADLQKWEKGFSGKKKRPHAGMWNPTYWYPSPLMPVAGMVVLGRGLAVIICEDYDPENQPERLLADYFDFDLNYLGVVHLPFYTYWNCPMVWESAKARKIFRWHQDRLFYIDYNDEEQPTLSRWRME